MLTKSHKNSEQYISNLKIRRHKKLVNYTEPGRCHKDNEAYRNEYFVHVRQIVFFQFLQTYQTLWSYFIKFGFTLHQGWIIKLGNCPEAPDSIGAQLLMLPQASLTLCNQAIN